MGMDNQQKADIRKVLEKLYRITLFPPIPGFANFISVWLYKGPPCFIVDIGPSVTIPQLITALKSLEVYRIDYLFLTHIHIDHAGGAGDFLHFFPETPVIVHPEGISHLIDPSRLWKGSVEVLGEIAKAYKPIKPVPENLLMDVNQFHSYPVEPILTPGHSAHHISYQFEDILFAGEAAGVNLSEAAGQAYLRPATPPRFFLETFVQSLDRLLDRNTDLICYGHWGAKESGREWMGGNVEPSPVEIVIQHAGQICGEPLLGLDGIPSEDDGFVRLAPGIPDPSDDIHELAPEGGEELLYLPGPHIGLVVVQESIVDPVLVTDELGLLPLEIHYLLQMGSERLKIVILPGLGPCMLSDGGGRRHLLDQGFGEGRSTLVGSGNLPDDRLVRIAQGFLG